MKRITSKQGIKKVEFTDKVHDKNISHIEIILTIDYTLEQRLMKVTKNGVKFVSEAGYKILINTGNDLY